MFAFEKSPSSYYIVESYGADTDHSTCVSFCEKGINYFSNFRDVASVSPILKMQKDGGTINILVFSNDEQLFLARASMLTQNSREFDEGSHDLK